MVSGGTGGANGVRNTVHTGSSRYECPVCREHFCVDCDVFAHEVVHNCPGCQSGNLHGMSLMGEEVSRMQIDEGGERMEVDSRG